MTNELDLLSIQIAGCKNRLLEARSTLIGVESDMFELERRYNEELPVFYDTMAEYAFGADISQYTNNYNPNGEEPIMIQPFYVPDDPDFRFVDNDTETKHGKDYVRVYWGENERSYLLADSMWDISYIRYEWTGTEYKSDGTVYPDFETANEV